MMIADSYKSIRKIEQEAERKSALATFVALLLLTPFFLFWKAMRDVSLPPGEVMYEIGLGGMPDFGNNTNGSQQINNFDAPVLNPTPTRSVQAQAPPATTTPRPAPAEQELVANDPASPVTSTSKPVETKPTTPAKPNTQAPAQPQVDDDLLYKPGSTGGSNHGTNTSGTGNAGAPDVKTLDPAGMYTFGGGGGGGGGGLGSRRPISLGYPKYEVQEEGDVTFEFQIGADGSVELVKAVGVVSKPGLRDAGIAAIKKWKFTPSENGETQRVRVTIKFRLR
jgi:TonB family protein